MQIAQVIPSPSRPVRRSDSVSSNQSKSNGTHNVGQTERLFSTLAGAYCVLRGMRRGGVGGIASAATGAGLLWRASTGHCGVYQKLGIDTAHAAAKPSAEERARHGTRVSVVYTINKPADELFAFWRNLENLPTFMKHLEQVRVIDQKRSHWKAKAPAGQSVEWEAEIINEQPNRLIAWQSVENSDIHSTGSVRFIDAGDRGTEVRVEMNYIPPAGAVGKALARLFGEEPQQQIKEDLRRFKRLMETGEIANIDNQPHGTCRGRHTGQETP